MQPCQELESRYPLRSIHDNVACPDWVRGQYCACYAVAGTPRTEVYSDASCSLTAQQWHHGPQVEPWGPYRRDRVHTSDLRQRVLAAVFGWLGAADVRSSAGSGTEREFNVGKSLHARVPYPAVTAQPSIPRKMALEPVLGRLERACVYEMCVQGSTGYRVITRRRIMYARTVFFRYRGLGKRCQWSIISQL